MKNLLQVLIKYNFLILFLVLEVVAISLIVRNNNFQRASFASSANAISGGIYEKSSNITEFVNLKDENTKLALENANLKNLLEQINLQKADTFETYFDSSRTLQFSFTPAKIINNSVNKTNNFFTLNKGKLHGLKPDMAVVSTNGVVGILKNVSANFASGISLLHTGTKISSRIKSNGYFGSLVWNKSNSESEMTLKDIPSHVKLTAGDSVVTSGYSTAFPKGLPIGTITSWEDDESGSFHSITIQLFNNFRKLQNVYVIANLKKKEQIELERLSIANANGE